MNKSKTSFKSSSSRSKPKASKLRILSIMSWLNFKTNPKTWTKWLKLSSHLTKSEEKKNKSKQKSKKLTPKTNTSKDWLAKASIQPICSKDGTTSRSHHMKWIIFSKIKRTDFTNNASKEDKICKVNAKNVTKSSRKSSLKSKNWTDKILLTCLAKLKIGKLNGVKLKEPLSPLRQIFSPSK